MRLVTITMIVLTALAMTESYQITAEQNMVRTRGQTRVLDRSQVVSSANLGTQVMLPLHPLVFSGLLVDASCVERTPFDLRQPPESMAAKQPAQPPAAAQAGQREGSASGITVDAATLAAAHADIDPHLVPEIFSRQPDPSCAITSSTSSFALLTSDNRLLNLDEGGNTFVSQALLSDPAAHAMLNGAGPAVKPWTVVQGVAYGDKLTVDRVLRLGAAFRPPT